jgi:hypothetical protein
LNDSYRRLLSRLLEDVGNHDRVAIKAIHDSPRPSGIDHANLMTRALGIRKWLRNRWRF